MLKKILIIILLISFLPSVVCANVKINFLKEKYVSGDSVQAEVFFENLSSVEPLSYSDIKLYDGDVRIPIGLNLYKLKDNYFVYFELPALEAKEYKFALEDIVYPEKGILVKKSFYKNLSVIEGEGVSVNPGIIYLNIEQWENPRIGIEIKNKASEDILVSFGSGSNIIKFDNSDYLLKQGKIYFLSMILAMREYSGSEFESEVSINYLNNSYKIPIIVNKLSSEIIPSEGGEVAEIVEKADLRFVESKDKVERILRKSDRLEGSLSFKNFGNKTISGFSFLLTDNLKDIIRLDYKGDFNLKGGEEKSVYVYINENKDIAKNYTGELIIKAGDTEARMPVYIYYKPEEINENKNEINNYTLINYSAINQPKLPKGEKSKAWIYGVVILFIMIFLYLIYYFYEKGKPKKKQFESLIPTFSK